jgi:hypothetical protein
MKKEEEGGEKTSKKTKAQEPQGRCEEKEKGVRRETSQQADAGTAKKERAQGCQQGQPCLGCSCSCCERVERYNTETGTRRKRSQRCFASSYRERNLELTDQTSYVDDE